MKLNKYGELEENGCARCGYPLRESWVACPECGAMLKSGPKNKKKHTKSNESLSPASGQAQRKTNIADWIIEYPFTLSAFIVLLLLTIGLFSETKNIRALIGGGNEQFIFILTAFCSIPIACIICAPRYRDFGSGGGFLLLLSCWIAIGALVVLAIYKSLISFMCVPALSIMTWVLEKSRQGER